MKALRYRWAQALVVLVLSIVVTACLVVAPLYTRALEQADVASLLSAGPAPTTGLRLASTNIPSLAVTPERLVEAVPPELLRYFGAPIASTSVQVRKLPLGAQPGGRLLARDGACDHLTLASGRCPTGAGEVAISTDQAAAYALGLGRTLTVGEFDSVVDDVEITPRVGLQVVGLYRESAPTDPYWFGDRLTGRASARLGYDTMLTTQTTLDGLVTGPNGEPSRWFLLANAVDLPIIQGSVGIDQIEGLGAGVAAVVEHPLGPDRSATDVGRGVVATSGLPGLAEQVRIGSSQASVTVPLLMGQLGLLVTAVLWLVLVAAADQRRGEVALARLRGRGSRGARRLLLAETLPPVVLGVPVGALLAIGLTTLARLAVFPSHPPYEFPWSAAVAVAAALVLMVLVAVLSVRRVSNEPVASLLRTVPVRRAGVRFGILEAVLAAAAAAAFAATVNGSVSGPVGQVAPTLLAVAAGIVASRVLPPLLARVGGRLLRRGHPTGGAALLASSRRGTTRWLVPVVVVALCVVVVTSDTLAVGARNWADRAAAEVGAPTVLSVDSDDLPSVVRAATAIDPSGQHVTPVAVVEPSADGGVATVGVVPSAFRRIAQWPGIDTDALPWDRLTAPTVPPLVLTGTTIRYHVVSSPLYPDPASAFEAPTVVVLALQVVRSDGTLDAIPLGRLPRSGISADQSVTVGCASGCRTVGIGVLAPLGAAGVTATLTLSGLTVDRTAVDLGGGVGVAGTPGGQGASSPSWRDTLTGGVGVRATFTPGSVLMRFATNGPSGVFLEHASVPGVVPAFTSASATPSDPRSSVAAQYVDGTVLSARSVVSIPFVPGGAAASSLVDIGNLLAERWTGKGSARLSVFLDTRDPGAVARVRDALSERGLPVATSTDSAAVAASFRRSAAAWSLELALAAGLLSTLAAAVGIVVLASTSRRARSRDYAGLRLVGASSRELGRFAQLETAPVIVVSALLGVAVGLWTSPVAVGLVAFFTSPSTIYPLDLEPAWRASLLAGGAGLVVVVLVGFVTSRLAARRADLQRLRETV